MKPRGFTPAPKSGIPEKRAGSKLVGEHTYEACPDRKTCEQHHPEEMHRRGETPPIHCGLCQDHALHDWLNTKLGPKPKPDAGG